MQRFYDYVETLDPSFTSRIHGADKDAIAKLEKLAGRPLPTAYGAFLRKMGVDDGGLNITFDGSTNISDIIDYYTTEVVTGERKLPDQVLLIGVGAVSITDIGLDCKSPSEPSVVFTDGADITGLYGKSLETLLCNSAFSKYRMAQFPKEKRLTASFAEVGRESVLKRASTVATSVGYRSLWFSDSVTWCAENNDGAICVTQFNKQGIGVRVAGFHEHELDRVAVAISREIPALKRR